MAMAWLSEMGERRTWDCAEKAAFALDSPSVSPSVLEELWETEKEGAVKHCKKLGQKVATSHLAPSHRS